MAVLVCANDTGVLYFAKERKGHEGVKDTPIETYQGALIDDHDMTFYNYGGDHQECLEHVRRYLKDSMANEPNLKWNGQMRQLINEMIQFKNDILPDHLLFLYNKDIDPTNNLSERLLRIFKRKQQQVMAFRNLDGLVFLCNSLGVIATLCSHDEGLYQRVSDIFDRPQLLNPS